MLPIRDLCAFVLCFLQQKIATFCYVVFWLIARWRHRRLLKTAHNYAQLRTMVDFIVLSIKLVFMVLGVSYSRGPTGCCSASLILCGYLNSCIYDSVAFHYRAMATVDHIAPSDNVHSYLLRSLVHLCVYLCYILCLEYF